MIDSIGSGSLYSSSLNSNDGSQSLGESASATEAREKEAAKQELMRKILQALQSGDVLSLKGLLQDLQAMGGSLPPDIASAAKSLIDADKAANNGGATNSGNQTQSLTTAQKKALAHEIAAALKKALASQSQGGAQANDGNGLMTNLLNTLNQNGAGASSFAGAAPAANATSVV